MSAEPITHIRPNGRPIDRRMRNRFIERPDPVTLCGAPITDRDWDVATARSPRNTPEDFRRFGLCLECYLTIRASQGLA